MVKAPPRARDKGFTDPLVMIIVYLVYNVPKTRSHAYTSPHAEFWKEAYRDEFIIANETYKIVDYPNECKHVECKRTFKKKFQVW
jgi:hypothetical protein